LSQGKGTKPDPLNAYVFSQLAKAQDTPEANDLATQLETPLTPEQRAEGQRLVQQELAARGTLAQSTLQLHALQEEDGEESL
jgi:alginate biosynthesis protein AlgK